MSICVTIFIHKFCNKGDKYITERLKLVKTDGFAHRFLSHGFTVIHQYFYSFHWLALDGRLISFDFPTSQPLFHIVSPFAHRIHFSICIWGASSTFFVGVQIFFLWSGAVDFGYTHLTLSFEKAISQLFYSTYLTSFDYLIFLRYDGLHFIPDYLVYC